MMTYPALGSNPLRTLASNPNANDVSGRVEETLTRGYQLLVANRLHEDVNRHRTDQLLVTNCGAVAQSDNLSGCIHAWNLPMSAKTSVLLWQSVGNSNPNASSSATCWETESRIWTPIAIRLLHDDIVDYPFEIWCSYSFTKPGALHLLSIFYQTTCVLQTRFETYLGCWKCPHFEVVRSHEKIRNTNSHHSDNPFIESCRWSIWNTCLHGRVNHACNTFDLILLRQHGDVILKRIRDPKILAADIRYTLVDVPVILHWQSFINAIIEIFIMREYNMTAHIIELICWLGDFKHRKKQDWLTNPSAVTSVEARPPGVAFESMISHDGPSIWLRRLAAPRPVGPLPIIRTSTLLRAVLATFASRTQWENLHVCWRHLEAAWSIEGFSVDLSSFLHSYLDRTEDRSLSAAADIRGRWSYSTKYDRQQFISSRVFFGHISIPRKMTSLIQCVKTPNVTRVLEMHDVPALDSKLLMFLWSLEVPAGFSVACTREKKREKICWEKKLILFLTR